MNDKKKEILRNLTEDQKNELRTFLKSVLAQSEIYYAKESEGIVLNYGFGEERLHSTVELKKKINEILEKLRND
jgi:hypothetical protein